MKKLVSLAFFLGLATTVSSLAGCGKADTPTCACAGRVLRVATTTSVDNTGLLAALLPEFEKRTGIHCQIIAVGTGHALALGRNGDVDAVMVHDREAEDLFMKQGHGVNHRGVMHNDFVLVGPAADPAGVAGLSDVVWAFKKMADAKAPFASRGDDSGTNMAELRLWKAAGRTPTWDGYMESGQGQRATLTLADQKQAYMLLDRGTWISAEHDVALTILVQGNPSLFNYYSIMAVNPATHPSTHYVEAMALIAWVTSVEGQKIIGDFKMDGKVLFHPDVIVSGPAAKGK